jgi:hypothetical protein
MSHCAQPGFIDYERKWSEEMGFKRLLTTAITSLFSKEEAELMEEVWSSGLRGRRSRIFLEHCPILL